MKFKNLNLVSRTQLSMCNRFKDNCQHSIRIFVYYCTFILSVGLLLSQNASALELTDSEQAFVDQQQIIRVHNESDWPPFNFYQNGEAKGLSIDVMDLVAEKTGLKIEYISGPTWDEFIQMMRDGSLDVMLNIVDMPERREFLQFTNTYSRSMTGIFTTNAKSEKYFSFDDLKGKNIAIIAGFDLEISLPKAHPEVIIIKVNDTLELIEAIHSGRADAFMDEVGVVDYIVSQRMITNVRLAFQATEKDFIADLHIATGHRDDQLLSIIQKGLNAITTEEYAQISNKWLHETQSVYEQHKVNLTVAEKEYLFSHPVVNICVDPVWPPLDFIDKDGVHSGLSADLINTIAKRINVTLNLVPTTTWSESLTKLKAGDCDIIPLMNEIEGAKEYIDFTQPYFKFATIIATRDDVSFIADYSDLYGKKVALESYYFINDYIRKHHPQIEVVEVDNIREALKYVSENKAYATIDGLPNIVNNIEALALENVKVAGSVPQENNIKLGVRKGNKHLLSIFEKGVASLTEEEKVGFYKKWFDIKVSESLFDNRWFIRFGIVFAIIIAFLLWRQFTIGKYVATLKQLNEKLIYTSTTDHLTEIANRHSIEKQLLEEYEKTNAQSPQDKEPLSVLLLDIDHFKQVNDNYGHLTGDMVLKEVASLLSCSIRATDHIGRWGGEEFLIVLPNTDNQQAENLANYLKDRIECHSFRLDRPITGSFGIAQFREGESISSLLARSDNGLYAAKDLGRNAIFNMECNS